MQKSYSFWKRECPKHTTQWIFFVLKAWEPKSDIYSNSCVLFGVLSPKALIRIYILRSKIVNASKRKNTMNIRRSHSVGTQERPFGQFTPWPFRPQQKSVRSIIVVTSLHTKVTSLRTEVTSFHDIIKVYRCLPDCICLTDESELFATVCFALISLFPVHVMLMWLMRSWYFALVDRWPIEV